MYIIDTLYSNIKSGDKEINYSFRMIGEKLNIGQSFGIEVERQDLIEGKVVQIERDIIERISTKDVFLCIIRVVLTGKYNNYPKNPYWKRQNNMV